MMIDQPTIFDHLLVVLLVSVLPLYSCLTYPSFKLHVQGGSGSVLAREYVETIIILWFGAGVVLACWLVQGRTLENLGFRLPGDWWFLGCTILVGAILLLLTVQVFQVARHEQYRAQVRAQMKSLGVDSMVPRLGLEYRLFVLVSISAGVCEEVLYRGYLLAYLNYYLGTAGAVILSSIFFGIAHVYQGTSGIVRTSVLGAIGAVLLLVSGSLWLPIILHAAVDIQGGTVGWLSMRSRSSAMDKPSAG